VPVSVGEMVSASEFAKQCRAKMWEKVGRLNWRPFEEARDFVHALNIKSNIEWRKYCNFKIAKLGKRPWDIPSNPNTTYLRTGWRGYSDWLGNKNFSRMNCLSFKKARQFARRLNLNKQSEWVAFCKGDLPLLGKLPLNIPADPKQIYADLGWVSMGDWLGTNTVSSHLKSWRSFYHARAFARQLNLKGQKQWRDFCSNRLLQIGSRPQNIPTCPDLTYANHGWSGYGDWLGTRNVAKFQRVYRSFTHAKKFVHALRLENYTQWRLFAAGKFKKGLSLPKDIPSAPWVVYFNRGWISIGDWLGTESIATYKRNYRPFKKARAFARSLNLATRAQWINFRKGKYPKLGTLPLDIPNKPEHHYANKGWKGMKDWLGTND